MCDSPFTGVFYTHSIRRIMELGLIKYWKTKYEIVDVCEDPTAAQTSGTAIAMDDSFWLFVALAVGVGIALILLR